MGASLDTGIKAQSPLGLDDPRGDHNAVDELPSRGVASDGSRRGPLVNASALGASAERDDPACL